MSGLDWSVNLSGNYGDSRYEAPYGYSQAEMSDTSILKNPASGKDTTATSSSTTNSAEIAKNERLKNRKLWEAARSPVSTLMMCGFTMYMTGSRISIFSLIMIVMSTMNLFKGLFNVNNGT